MNVSSIATVRYIRQESRWREDLPGRPERWFLAPLLVPAWMGFAVGATARRWAYDLGGPSHRVAAPVISVGNVVAGGSGKTPVALSVAGRIQALGLRPGIISRGYRAGPDGRNEEAALAGNVPVFCDPQRARGAAAALASGVQAIVMDDGFQHRALHRDLDILVIDATRPFGAARGVGWMLPLGYRREGLPALHRADLFWLTRTDLADPARVDAVRARLARCGAPVISDRRTGWHWSHPVNGRQIILASGIGHPEGFTAAAIAAAQGLGATVVEHWAWPDHFRYGPNQAQLLAQRARAVGALVVTTSKDAVKLSPLWPHTGATEPLVVLTGSTDLSPADSRILDDALTGVLGSVKT